VWYRLDDHVFKQIHVFFLLAFGSCTPVDARANLPIARRRNYPAGFCARGLRVSCVHVFPVRDIRAVLPRPCTNCAGGLETDFASSAAAGAGEQKTAERHRSGQKYRVSVGSFYHGHYILFIFMDGRCCLNPCHCRRAFAADEGRAMLRVGATGRGVVVEAVAAHVIYRLISLERSSRPWTTSRVQ